MTANITDMQLNAVFLTDLLEGMAHLDNDGKSVAAQIEIAKKMAGELADALDSQNFPTTSAEPKAETASETPEWHRVHDEMLGSLANLYAALRILAWDLSGQSIQKGELNDIRAGIIGITDAMEPVFARDPAFAAS